MTPKVQALILAIIVAGLLIILANGARETRAEVLELGADIPVFSFQSRPDLSGTGFQGNEYAPLTLTVYTDFRSEAARYFHEEILPQLREEYIYADQMRYYPKYHLTKEDVREQTQSFTDARTHHCLASQAPADAVAIHDALFTEEPLKIAEHYSIGEEAFTSCMDGPVPETLLRDMAETERFGMVGVIPRLYIGIDGRELTALDGLPSYPRLARTIRDYQTRVGI